MNNGSLPGGEVLWLTDEDIEGARSARTAELRRASLLGAARRFGKRGGRAHRHAVNRLRLAAEDLGVEWNEMLAAIERGEADAAVGASEPPSPRPMDDLLLDVLRGLGVHLLVIGRARARHRRRTRRRL